MLDVIRVRAQSWGVKLVFGVIILVFVFWGVGNMDTGSSRTVAKVNGQEISIQEYAREVESQLKNVQREQPSLAAIPEVQEEIKQNTLQLLVSNAVIEQEAERLGIFVSPQELFDVLSKIGLFQDKEGKFDRTRYMEALKARQIVPGEFEESYRKQLLKEKVQGYISLGVDVTEDEARNFFNFSLEKRKAEYLLLPSDNYKANAAPADAEISKYYTDNVNEFQQPARISLDYIILTPQTLAVTYPPSREEVAAFYDKNKARFVEPASYDSRQIFLRCPPEGSTEDGAEASVAKARALAADIVAQIKKGADFGELAIKYSEDPNSAAKGGALGWLNKGVLPAEIDTAAFALKKGDVSAPVRSQFGFHIIKLNDKKDEQTRTLAQAEAEIMQHLGVEKARADFEQVQNKASEALRIGKSLADMGKEFKLKVESSGIVFQDLVPSLLALQPSGLEVLKNIPNGKVAPSPLEVKDGIALVQVKERLAPALTPLEEARSQITVILTDKKAQELALAAAQETVVAMASGKQQIDASKIKETPVFLRIAQTIAPFGDVPLMHEALGGAPLNTWLPSAYAVPEGAVVIRVSSIAPATDEEWAKQKDMFMSRFLQRKREETVQALMRDLIASAKISTNSDAIKQMRLR